MARATPSSEAIQPAAGRAPGDRSTTVPATPPAEILYRRRLRLVQSIRNSWQHRELLRSLTERQLRSRYKQATLGFIWALAAPLSLLLVFVVFADRVADIDTGGVPYSLFAFTGLLAWTFFSSSVNGASQSLLSNTSLLNKTACPRELFPLSTVIVAGVDTALASIVLVVLFVATQTLPEPATVYVPLLMLVQIVLTVGVSFVISILVVFVRDIRHALPLFLQVGVLVTPVAYGFEVVPVELRWVYAIVNPLGPLIDGYRRTMLQNESPQWQYVGLATLSSCAILVFGFWLLKRLEGGIVDVT
jgi:ABC-2 type transport system permease protein/lipopolysaccharide transport system permease protein